MEKIIAVVVMIAIVVGLIALVVRPMSKNMEEKGDDTTKQMNQLSTGDVFTKTQLITDAANAASGVTYNIVTKPGSKTTLGTQTGSSTYEKVNSLLNGEGANVDTSVKFVRSITGRNPDGSVSEYTFTEQ